MSSPFNCSVATGCLLVIGSNAAGWREDHACVWPMSQFVIKAMDCIVDRLQAGADGVFVSIGWYGNRAFGS